MAAEHFSPNFLRSCFSLVLLRLGFYDFRLSRESARVFLFRSFPISRCYDCWASYFSAFFGSWEEKPGGGVFCFLRWGGSSDGSLHVARFAEAQDGVHMILLGLLLFKRKAGNFYGSENGALHDD